MSVIDIRPIRGFHRTKTIANFKQTSLTYFFVRLRFLSGLRGTRIPNLLIRSQMLYPIKLRVLAFAGAKIYYFFENQQGLQKNSHPKIYMSCDMYRFF